MREIAVIRTGTANLASVLAGLTRAKCDPVLIDDPASVISADYVVLPGVGTFSAVMDKLTALGLVEAIRQRINEARPTMAICLGLQVLGSSSEESPGTQGLGIFDGRALRFDGGLPVPQLGWNRVHPEADCRLLCEGYGYFANSYRLDEAPRLGGGNGDYGGPFVAAIERGPCWPASFTPSFPGSGEPH